jgi:hypothetical protein
VAAAVTPHQGGTEFIVGVTGLEPGFKNIKGIGGLAGTPQIVVAFYIGIMIRHQIRILKPEQFFLNF